MSQKQTVVINGREYDARTGLPATGQTKVATRDALRGKNTVAPTQKTHTAKHPAQEVHTKTQRSQTLNRKFVKKPNSKAVPTPIKAPVQPIVTQIPSRKRIDGMIRPEPTGSRARTNHQTVALQAKKQPVQLQAPVQTRPTMSQVKPKAQNNDIAPAMPHPAVTRAHTIQTVRREQSQKEIPSANTLKTSIINDTLANAPKHTHKQLHHISKRMQLTSIICGCAALVLFGGYLTYLNVPNISVKVAAAQAGIDASYPSYQPDGYKLNGPVAYNKGSVKMQFAANTGSSGFTLQQSRSNWDSNALLENYIKSKTNDYTITQDKGITIYTYGGNAAWVSGGILHTIDGNAPLSPDQIRKIATSLS